MNASRTRVGGSQPWRAFRAQTRVELTVASRRGENLLVTILIPLLLLVFFASVPLLPAPPGGGSQIDQLVPGILALAIISTGLVSLGIATAFERSYGVLKRLGGSPLPRPALLGAKAAVVLLTEAIQVALIAVTAAVLGWAPTGGIPEALGSALPWLLLGSVTFCALGLLLAGALRAEAVLALANGIYLVFLLLGGVIIPLDHLPAAVADVAALLPPAQLATLLRGAMEPWSSFDPLPAIGLTTWTVFLVVGTLATFRTE